MTKMSSSITRPPDSDKPNDVVENRHSIQIRRLAITHFTFMVVYWAASMIAVMTLQLLHNPGWVGVTSFEYDLIALLLSVLPMMLVMSVNLGRLRKILEVESTERSPVLIGCILIVIAILLLIPITWFMRNPTASILVIPVITGSVTWLVSIIYVVSAGSISSSSPKQFVKRGIQRPQFWLVIGLASLLILVSLFPLVAGLLGSEAWQYYTFEELLLRRLPIFAILTWPASIMLPILPLTLMYYTTEGEITYQ